jgi:hypothetical protein
MDACLHVIRLIWIEAYQPQGPSKLLLLAKTVKALLCDRNRGFPPPPNVAVSASTPRAADKCYLHASSPFLATRPAVTGSIRQLLSSSSDDHPPTMPPAREAASSLPRRGYQLLPWERLQVTAHVLMKEPLERHSAGAFVQSRESRPRGKKGRKARSPAHELDARHALGQPLVQRRRDPLGGVLPCRPPYQSFDYPIGARGATHERMYAISMLSPLALITPGTGKKGHSRHLPQVKTSTASQPRSE